MKVSQSYKSYRPPVDIVPCVERLIATVPEHHVKSLECIHLTDSASIGKGKTHRVQGKKYIRRQCLGFYHPAYANGAPWIELTIDQMFKNIPPVLVRRKFIQDVVIADTLFHELGHHIEYSNHAANRASETKAEEWRRQFKRHHIRRHYWWLRALLFPVWLVYVFIRKMRRPANQAL